MDIGIILKTKIAKIVSLGSGIGGNLGGIVSVLLNNKNTILSSTVTEDNRIVDVCKNNDNNECTSEKVRFGYKIKVKLKNENALKEANEEMQKLGNFLWEDFVWCLGARKIWGSSNWWVLDTCGRSAGWWYVQFTGKPKDSDLEVTYDGKTY